MGRPRKEIPKMEFEGLIYIGCTRQEIVDYFDFEFRAKSPDGKGGVSEETINRWCKRTYKRTFAEMLELGRTRMKIKLRRNQIKLSEKSASMAIFLGKNLLGQTDVQTITVANHDESIKEMDDYFDRKKRGT